MPDTPGELMVELMFGFSSARRKPSWGLLPPGTKMEASEMVTSKGMVLDLVSKREGLVVLDILICLL